MHNVDIAVSNASNAPIFGVTPTIVVTPVDGGGRDRRIPVRLRNTQVGPQSHSPWDGIFLDEADRVADDLSNIELDVEFTDAHGRRWRRRGDDQPVRVFDQE